MEIGGRTRDRLEKIRQTETTCVLDRKCMIVLETRTFLEIISHNVVINQFWEVTSPTKP